MKAMTIAVTVAMTLVAAGTAAYSQPSFQGLGDLPGGNFESLGWGVSGDGLAAVGRSVINTDGDTEAFRWTLAESMVGLGDLPGGRFGSQATAASADGSVVVGASFGSTGKLEPFRWRDLNGNGLVDPFEKLTDHPEFGLGYLPGGDSGTAQDVSPNGSFIVGVSTSSDLPNGEAFRWNASEGMVGLGCLLSIPGAGASFATGVADNGSVVVGVSRSSTGNQAFRWLDLNGNGLVDPDEKLGYHREFGLGYLPDGDPGSAAIDVTPDGSVVVGSAARSGGAHRAVYWDAAGAIVALPELPGAIHSSANAVSDDACVIVGSMRFDWGWEAVVWHQEEIRTLEGILDGLGLGPTIAGWQLTDAADVSLDGMTIVGHGINPGGDREAWIAVVPEPSTLSLLTLSGLALIGRRR